jgi:hypothetical protein
MLDQRIELRPRAEVDEEQRDEDPVGEPVISTLVPLASAIHDNVNRTRRDRRTSSAYRRRFERSRTRCAKSLR